MLTQSSTQIGMVSRENLIGFVGCSISPSLKDQHTAHLIVGVAAAASKGC